MHLGHRTITLSMAVRKYFTKCSRCTSWCVPSTKTSSSNAADVVAALHKTKLSDWGLCISGCLGRWIDGWIPAATPFSCFAPPPSVNCSPAEAYAGYISLCSSPVAAVREKRIRACSTTTPFVHLFYVATIAHLRAQQLHLHFSPIWCGKELFISHRTSTR